VYEEMAHGLKALKVPENEVERRVEAVLKTVHLDERKDSSPFLLSHGQKRRLSVACMVISEPEVVILDEPTFGQDWRQAGRLMTYMRSLADAGAAVTFITHDMRLVAEYADRCVAMSDGRIIFEGGPFELFSAPDVLAAARLKAPPVFDFSRELLGEPTLGTAELIDQLEARFGRPGAVIQGS
jgi:energy-coupling factor transport system ATP-binding protein